MKLSGSIQVISAESTFITLDDAIAKASGLTEGDRLYVVALASSETEGAGEGPPRKVSLVGSPLIEAAWPHLIRLSATISPQQGSLQSLLARLGRLGIQARHIEVVNGLDLRGMELCPPTGSPNRVRFVNSTTSADLIIPSATLIVELPKPRKGEAAILKRLRDLARPRGRKSRRGKESDARLDALPMALQAQLEELPVAGSISGLVRKEDARIRIDWISPMSTLNRLADVDGPTSPDDAPEQPKAKRAAGATPVPRRATRATVTRAATGAAEEGRRPLAIDLQPWRNMLWSLHQRIPFRAGRLAASRYYVQQFADSDERVLCFDFFSFDDEVIVEFDVRTPTGGAEHIWWDYIYSCVRYAHGNILTTFSSARRDGYWSVLKVTAVFPLRESAKELRLDLERFVTCFRRLQGDRSYSPAFLAHCLELDSFHGSFSRMRRASPDPRGNEATAEHASSLEHVRIYGIDLDRLRLTDVRWFAPNPFNFTNPLDLDYFRSIYDVEAKSPIQAGSASDVTRSAVLKVLAWGEEPKLHNNRTRLYLAERIIRHLTGAPGESLVIVGAHRSGKTSVLNLVDDLLCQPDIHETGILQTSIVPLVLRINAALVPPELFLAEIISKLVDRHSNLPDLAALAKDVPAATAKARQERAKRLTFLVGRILGSLGSSLSFLGLKFDVELSIDKIYDAFNLYLYGQSKEGARSQKELKGAVLGAAFGDRSREITLIRRVFEALRQALLEANDSEEKASRRADPIRLIVIIDEFSDSLRWSDDSYLPVWRHVIESKAFSAIRWLISTSRPVNSTSSYSPISNSLIEYNVGALRKEEAHQLLRAFSINHWRADFLAGNDGEKGALLRPVLTARAQEFILQATNRLPYLMQVTCFHLYEHFMRSGMPLINREICIQVVQDKVLPELADYFEGKWKDLPEESRKRVVADLGAGGWQGVLPFLNGVHDWTRLRENHADPTSRYFARSGLSDDDGRTIAPLVMAWLLHTGLA